MATAINLPYSPRGYPLRQNEKAIPVEEYLATSFHPDMDYVDGHVEDRNMGDPEHSAMQNALLTVLNANAKAWGIRVYPECRLQVKADRFRVPDILLVRRDEKPVGIVRKAPVLCIEILSPDDTFHRMQSRLDDYVAMGVNDVWVLDPIDGRVFTVAEGKQQFSEGRFLKVGGTEISIDLSAIKADLAE